MKKKFFIALSITATILLVVFVGIKCVKYMYVCDILYSNNIVFEDVNNTDLKDFWTEVGIDAKTVKSVEKLEYSAGRDSFYYVYFSIDKANKQDFMSSLLHTYEEKSLSDSIMGGDCSPTDILEEKKYFAIYEARIHGSVIFVFEFPTTQNTVNYCIFRDGGSDFLYNYCYDRVAKTILWGI